MANRLSRGFRKLFRAPVKAEPKLAVEDTPSIHVKSGFDLTAHMARLNEIRTLFPEGNAYVGAADKYYSEDEELDYLFDSVGELQRFPDGLMSHRKPWYHTIQLIGENLTTSEAFYTELVKRLRYGPVSPYASYQQTFDWLLSDLVSYLPEKNFVTPVFREHELRSLAPAAFEQEDIKATVGAAYLNDLTLEFSYENTRRRAGGSNLETHYRRVKVRRLNGDRGFQAWNHLGYKTFLFSKIRSAIAAPKVEPLAPDVLVVVTFDGAGKTDVRRLSLNHAEADVRKQLEEGRRGTF